jgi:branched-chain amino acid transport system ATP-binding protein
MSETTLLSAHELSKHFGGLTAVNKVSLSLFKGRIHAVIGPNGAGKSTLTNLLSGDIAPSSGQVMLGQRNITGLAPERVSRAGIGRSFQKTNIFPSFTVWENTRLAAQSRKPRAAALWRNVNRMADTNNLAERALALAELSTSKNRIASALSHGEQRQLEIAMCLATEPQVLLLDEPLAGMGAEEAARMVALLARLKQDHAILLIEHDMDAVFSLADELTVMVNGTVIATGTPQAIRENAQVQAAYLGEEQHA